MCCPDYGLPNGCYAVADGTDYDFLVFGKSITRWSTYSDWYEGGVIPLAAVLCHQQLGKDFDCPTCRKAA